MLCNEHNFTHEAMSKQGQLRKYFNSKKNEIT